MNYHFSLKVDFTAVVCVILSAGMWLVGLLVSGELFLWNKDKDSLKVVSAIPAVHELASSIRGLCENL